MSEENRVLSGDAPKVTWTGKQIVRITSPDGANLWSDRSMDSAVIRHYGEGHSLPVSSFMTTRKNGNEWYQVEAYNGHGIGYCLAEKVEPESFGDTSIVS